MNEYYVYMLTNNLRVAITGAAGNLGNLLAQGMIDMDINLNLLIHNKDIDNGLKNRDNISTFRVDLAKEDTLYDALM